MADSRGASGTTPSGGPTGRSSRSGPPGAASTGAGARPSRLEAVVGRLRGRAHHRHHRADLEVLHLAVGQRHDLGDGGVEQGVGPQRAADAAHDDRGVEPVPGDVTGHQPQPAGRQHERVVPVAADRAAVRGDVARGELEPRARGQPGGQQAPLEQLRGRGLDGQLPGLQRRGDAVTGDLQQLARPGC